jgi:two-component system chemotaxis response regulator CheY
MNGKVMIVDDSLLVRRQVGVALGIAGYQVIEACDGLDALDKLEPSLSLIVCDVNMPRMGGLELLERIHADPRLAAVPIVMLTTEASSELFARARELGAKAWLVKPFKPDLLVAAVRKLASARAA